MKEIESWLALCDGAGFRFSLSAGKSFFAVNGFHLATLQFTKAAVEHLARLHSSSRYPEAWQMRGAEDRRSFRSD